jgi:thiaminase/transcriptional activator TenA
MVKGNNGGGDIFSARVFERVQPLLARILSHPFNDELARGVLSKERFCAYMQQDSLYLLHFSRALAVTAGRTADEKEIETLLTASRNALLAERSLHEHYFAEYGAARAASENPACLGYTSFVLATAALGSLGEALAALLPCFWIYREAGNHIARKAVSPNPYARWIETYSDAAFSEGVDRFVELTDAAAARTSPADRAQMETRFMAASRFEYLFWDDVYRGVDFP